MVKEDYSRLTLSPNSKDERQSFLEFRTDDVALSFKYICILSSCESVLVLLIQIYSIIIGESTTSSMINLFYQLLLSTTCWALMISRKFCTKQMYLIGF